VSKILPYRAVATSKKDNNTRSEDDRISEDIEFKYQKIDKNNFKLEVIIIKDLPVECIIGIQAWNALGIVLDMKNNYLEIDGKGTQIFTGPCETTLQYTAIAPGMVGWVKCKTVKDKPVFLSGTTSESKISVVPGYAVPDHNGEIEVLVYNQTSTVLNIGDSPLSVDTDEDAEITECVGDDNFDINKITVGNSINRANRRKLVRLLYKNKDRFREKTGAGDRSYYPPVELILKKDAIPQKDKIYPRKPEDHELICKVNSELIDRGVVE
jgi:hypothetical protein